MCRCLKVRTNILDLYFLRQGNTWKTVFNLFFILQYETSVESEGLILTEYTGKHSNRAKRLWIDGIVRLEGNPKCNTVDNYVIRDKEYQLSLTTEHLHHLIMQVFFFSSSFFFFFLSLAIVALFCLFKEFFFVCVWSLWQLWSHSLFRSQWQTFHACNK